jgi:hypothetical protein
MIYLRLAGVGRGVGGIKIILAQLLSMKFAHFTDSFISTDPSAPQHQYAAQLLAIVTSNSKPRPLLLKLPAYS